MATSLESFAKEHCQHCWGQIKAGWFQEQTHRERISQETRLLILRHPQTPVGASVCPGPRETLTPTNMRRSLPFAVIKYPALDIHLVNDSQVKQINTNVWSPGDDLSEKRGDLTLH